MKLQQPGLKKRLIISLWMINLFIVTSLMAQGASRVLEINDPLTGSTTLGSRSGGVFTAQGWKTTGAFDNIEYRIPTCSMGELEFDVTGIYASNVVFPNRQYDKKGELVPGETNVHYALLNMYDRDDAGAWYGVLQWHNPYKCIMHVYGYVEGDIYKWRYAKLRLNVAAYSGGYDNDPHAFEDPSAGPIDWQKDKVFRMRLVWGEGHMRWYMNDLLFKEWDYSSFGVEYAPPSHSIRLGSGLLTKSGGFQVPINIVYSNFKFYRYVDNTQPEVVGSMPAAAANDVALDSDIMVEFSEPMDDASTKAALTITPAVPGTLTWIGNFLTVQRTGLLQANTTYTIQVSTSAKDAAGNALKNAFTTQFTTRNLMLTKVGRYEPYEVTLVASGLGTTNRYKNVSLKGVFTGPTQTLEIEGFWDGGDIFKVRIAPTELGTWSYTVTSTVASLNATGSFQVVDSASRGFIRRNPERPYSFMYDDGTPWLWRGDTSWRGFTSLLPYESRWKSYIDLRADQGYTAMQSIVVSFINGLGFWKNEGGTCFVELSDRKDYDQLNPGYFHWIDKRIDYALSKGIVPVIFFTWAQEYVNFSSVQFERYCRYLVARFAAKNVMWVLCGEHNEITNDYGRPTSEYVRFGNIVKQYDPYDHPLTLHPTGRSTSAEFGNENWYGYVMQQTPYYVRDVRRDRVYSKPVVNGEPRYFYPQEDNTESRRALWEIISNGGYFTSGFYTTYAPDKGGYDPSALPDEQKWVEIVNKFMGQIPWSLMDPHPELISSGNLMARLGKNYFAYHSTGGAVTLNLSGHLGSLQGKWLNPRTGVTSEPFSVQLGGSAVLTPPFTGDWVLYIGEEIIVDKVPPLAPTDLTLQSATNKSLSFEWKPGAAASDGDVADTYRILRDDVEISVQSLHHYTDAHLGEDKTYTYTIYAIDDAGNVSTTAVNAQFRTTADKEAPVMTQVQIPAADALVVHFSEPVDPVTAGKPGNYQVLQGIPIQSVEVAADYTSVRLRTGSHQANKYYALIARGIKDRARAANVMGSNNVMGYRLGQDFKTSGLTPANYAWAYIQVGDTYYMDRTLTVLEIPTNYQNLLWLKTRNDDKQVNTARFITFTISSATTIYVAYNGSATTLPAWLSTWQDTGQVIRTTDDSPLKVYAKPFAAGEVSLGGNAGDASSSMYVVLVKSVQDSGTGDQPKFPANVRVMSK